MRFIFKYLIFFFIVFDIHSQEVRTFSNWGVNVAQSNLSSCYEFSVGESLQSKRYFPIRITTSLTYTLKNLKTKDWRSNNIENAELFNPNSNFLVSNLNTPLGIEVFLGNFSIGINTDIFSIGISNMVDEENLKVADVSSIEKLRFSNIFAGEKRNNLNSRAYVNYTVNDSFSFLLGLINQKTIFNLNKEQNNSSDIIGLKNSSVFFGFRFNLEK